MKDDVAISALTFVILSAAKDLYEGKTIDSSVALLPQNDTKRRARNNTEDFDLSTIEKFFRLLQFST